MANANRKNQLAKHGIPAIVAVGSGLAALPAHAVQLSDVTVQSRLGQPLRASIAYALAPNEQIANYCVTMRPGPSVSGLPGIGNATVSVANGVITLTGSTPVKEPMVSAHVIVNCPYAAHLSREYMLFIDPLTEAYEEPAITQQSNTVSEPVAVQPAAISRPIPSVATTSVIKDISGSTRYQVQSGESLSEIAARIKDRPVGLWPAVNAIFAANPDAFINSDPNRVKAGAWLTIPDFNGSASIIEDTAPASASSPEPAVERAETLTPAVEGTHAAAAALEAYDTAATTAIEVPDQAEPILLDDLADDSASAAATNATTTIIDQNLPGPTTEATTPNVPVAIIEPKPAVESSSTSWLYWLAGGGIAAIIALLLLGRRFRGTSYTEPEASLAPQRYGRRASDNDSTDTENIEAIGVDYDLSDDSPTEENLALDADLVIGTGLEEGSTTVEEFGFAETNQIDIELPFEPQPNASDETGMLPPLRTDTHSILDSEVLPEDDDDYDMSVIVDATKMPQPGDVAELDLKAVEVTPEDETLIAQNYTINKEVDFQTLEQDYEDELTATQALNEEIARAAAELAETLEGNEAGSDIDDELTAALPLATVTELDITAQMPAQNDSDLDATINQEGNTDDNTVNMESDDATVEMPVEKKG